MQIILFFGALCWGVGMQMAYDRLTLDPSLSDRQVGYIALIYYLVAGLSLLAALAAGEGAFLGYIIGMFFIGMYRRKRRDEQ